MTQDWERRCDELRGLPTDAALNLLNTVGGIDAGSERVDPMPEHVIPLVEHMERAERLDISTDDVCAAVAALVADGKDQPTTEDRMSNDIYDNFPAIDSDNTVVTRCGKRLDWIAVRDVGEPEVVGPEVARRVTVYWDPGRMAITGGRGGGLGTANLILAGVDVEDLRLLGWSLRDSGRHEDVMLDLVIATGYAVCAGSSDD